MRFDHTTLGQRVLFGTGAAVENTAAALASLGATRVLLVADAFAVALADEVAARVAGASPVVARIDDVVQHVPVERGRAAVGTAVEHGADAVVSIGGGSSTGLAKFVARETGLPVVAVPTTYAGSEATNVWGQVEGERKTTGVDDRVLPRVVVYDAALLAGLPGSLARASALNAVAHAVDSLWAPRADPIDAALATEALRALVPGLRALSVGAGDDLEARERVLHGAYLAAVAFASAGSGLHHKVCHALGGAYGLSHAETHAVVLPHVVAFNAPAAPEAAARVLEAVGAGDDGGPGASAAGALDRLRRGAGVVGSLAELGLREDQVAEAAAIIALTVPASNPRPVAVADLEALLRAAWAGDPVEG